MIWPCGCATLDLPPTVYSCLNSLKIQENNLMPLARARLSHFMMRGIFQGPVSLAWKRYRVTCIKGPPINSRLSEVVHKISVLPYHNLLHAYQAGRAVWPLKMPRRFSFTPFLLFSLFLSAELSAASPAASQQKRASRRLETGLAVVFIGRPERLHVGFLLKACADFFSLLEAQEVILCVSDPDSFFSLQPRSLN